MVLTNDYYVVKTKTKSDLAKKLLKYLKKHQDGANIRDILNSFGDEYNSWEIKETVMQLISVGAVRLTSDSTLQLQD